MQTMVKTLLVNTFLVQTLEVQTFDMPKPPPPPPPEEVKPARATANHWVILIVLAIAGGLLAFYWLHWAPTTEAENARIAAEAAFVRPWPERAEAAVRSTFEGDAGHGLAASVQEALAPGATDAKLLGIEVIQTEKNLVSVFSMGWAVAAPEGQEQAEPSLATAKIKWTMADKKHIGVEYVGPEGGTALTADQDKAVGKIFTSNVYPTVRRNIADK